MTSKTVICALLLAAVAAVQGSSMKDLAVEYSQMLAEELSAGVDEIEKLKETAFDRVEQQQKDTYVQLMTATKDKVDKHTTGCNPQDKQQVHQQVQGTVTNRFLHCINFTDQITQLEKLILNVTDQVGIVESGVCLAITNLTSCSGEGVIEEVHCISSGLLGYINDFKQHSSVIKNIVNAFNKHLQQIADQFLQCFTSVDQDTVKIVQKAVNDKC